MQMILPEREGLCSQTCLDHALCVAWMDTDFDLSTTFR